MSRSTTDLTIKVPILARVEGEGALDLRIRDGAIEQLNLRIYEPPRLFEKLLEGRGYDEVPDIVARICGICPVAYQMSACHAIESVFGVDPGPWVRRMRRLFYCGEWLESHALHIHLLAAPDFLGYQSAIEMARHYPDEVRRGMRLQGLGNRILKTLGGRSVHPLGARVGGFYSAPSKAEMTSLLEACKEALSDARALVGWVATLKVPDEQSSHLSAAMRHPNEYPINEGRLQISDGREIAISDFPHYFRESHVAHSNALHSHYYPDGVDSGGQRSTYLVGPLARLNLNLDRLHPEVTEHLQRVGNPFPSRNMFHSALARAVEIHYAVVEAIEILREYQPTRSPAVEVTPRAGVGYGCTEAPRGILWHRFEVSDSGHIVSADIVPPTSQNLARIEENLAESLLAVGLESEESTLRLHSEMVVRNYDPCISCATHFLRLDLDRQ